LALLRTESRPEVRHQTGATLYEETRRAYRSLRVEADLVPFVDNMAEAYAWADLVICRSGALTVSELAAAGVGSVLVPFPHAVDDHQTANAAFLVEVGGAELMPQTGLSADSLADRLRVLLGNRWRLEVMAEAARSVARVDAAVRIIDEGVCRVRA
jgi:UDP-N-acetylglucosamine--N-acetylmuramyl-(pentapeptide) pyrophosphoryl-undecaprenol N-acetylglucosamine transferase